MKKNREKMPTIDLSLRQTTFLEVNVGYNLAQAKAEAERCLNCKNAPCKEGCPVGIDIPKFIESIKNNDIDNSYAIIKESNFLPSICGRVCPQEHQCEGVCVRKKIDESIAIGNLERFVSDNAVDKIKKDVTKINKKVAVIGSGPSSLTVAAELVKNGTEVIIFEAFHKGGGVLTYGIPEFRLPKDLVTKQIEKLIEMGVKVMYNAVIGKTITLKQLTDNFDAVYIGTGAGLPIFLGIKGENLNGVMSANELLTRTNLMSAYKNDSQTPLKLGQNIAVVGAGNVAIDAARTALRLGGKNVYIIYRRTEKEAPARAEEIEHAKQEGVKFQFLTNPIEIVGENGIVKGLKCVKMALGEMDASGRKSPLPIENSEFIFDCESVVIALGTTPSPLLTGSEKGLKVNKKGLIEVDKNYMTNLDGVYAGGDSVTGAATVILAMGAGKIAARAMLDRFKK